MIRRLSVAAALAALPLVPGAGAVSAQEYKQYCVDATTPTGPKPPMVCVMDPTPADES